MKSIAVYCGSSDRTGENYLSAAREMGKEIARRGMSLVYGAGSTGMMGAVAQGALDGGGAVIGVIPEIFDTPQLAKKDISRYDVTPDMHTRKARIAEMVDGFIALPGGYGTFEEFFEMVTWAQIGLHDKPIGLLNVNGFYDKLLDFLEVVRREGFIYDEHRGLFQVADNPIGLLEMMQVYRPPENLARWVDRSG
jgi:uncharacterized protein (TIGR00730 family)